MNATAQIEDAPSYDISALDHRVFEFSPLRCGNDYFGYTNRFQFDYDKAISVSGAAVDVAYIDRGAEKQLLDSFLNFDLGYYIDNPRVRHGWRYLMFVPWYVYWHDYPRDADGFGIYLSDGGHSENLAAYSLVRRLCKLIIIVDAGYDPTYTFEDYYLLKHGLLADEDLHGVLKVPAIENGSFSTTNESQPVMLGTITFPPPNQYGIPQDFSIKVIYVKLSLDKSKVKSNSYDRQILAYYESTIGHKEFTQTSEFPQESTLDQSFGKKQVRAYHALGYYMITNDERLILGEFGQTCKRPADNQ